MILKKMDVLDDRELIDSDGEPLDSNWHRLAMNLLIEVVSCHRRGTDFFAGGDMFIYFSARKVFNRDFRGPDFFFVDDVPWDPSRRFWVVWKETIATRMSSSSCFPRPRRKSTGR